VVDTSAPATSATTTLITRSGMGASGWVGSGLAATSLASRSKPHPGVQSGTHWLAGSPYAPLEDAQKAHA
jgi:hypothetical protein